MSMKDPDFNRSVTRGCSTRTTAVHPVAVPDDHWSSLSACQGGECRAPGCRQLLCPPSSHTQDFFFPHVSTGRRNSLPSLVTGYLIRVVLLQQLSLQPRKAN
ncbi:hypothetical protein SKAU_G00128670 [Synaphobranchus kaupii]|uniref:Uncharacterized protein n=1 Tax=Synaphobranchus kaupii TaxID=118154 RepID=A0A9Q1FQI4_SYNKA|nr:hypothetical protein SKAU_G00128670 [Synaphobranchus kaupii]